MGPGSLKRQSCALVKPRNIRDHGDSAFLPDKYVKKTT